jgi:hypothetical protein
MFESEENAEKAFTDIETARENKARVVFADDFGHRASIDGASIVGNLLEDMSKAKMSQVEHALHNTRVQILANKMGQSDPAIMAAMRGQGPAILAPMGNGRFPQ